MKKYTENQQKRLQEIDERQKELEPIINEAFVGDRKVLPLNYMLEARFLEVARQGIDLEARIAWLEEKGETSIEEGILEQSKRRLDMVKGGLMEMQNVGTLLGQYTALGYSFECVIEGEDENE